MDGDKNKRGIEDAGGAGQYIERGSSQIDWQPSDTLVRSYNDVDETNAKGKLKLKTGMRDTKLNFELRENGGN